MSKYIVSVLATKEGACHMNNGERREYTVEAENEQAARAEAIKAAYREGGLEHINPRKVTLLEKVQRTVSLFTQPLVRD